MKIYEYKLEKQNAEGFLIFASWKKIGELILVMKSLGFFIKEICDLISKLVSL